MAGRTRREGALAVAGARQPTRPPPGSGTRRSRRLPRRTRPHPRQTAPSWSFHSVSRPVKPAGLAVRRPWREDVRGARRRGHRAQASCECVAARSDAGRSASTWAVVRTRGAPSGLCWALPNAHAAGQWNWGAAGGGIRAHEASVRGRAEAMPELGVQRLCLAEVKTLLQIVPGGMQNVRLRCSCGCLRHTPASVECGMRTS